MKITTMTRFFLLLGLAVWMPGCKKASPPKPKPTITVASVDQRAVPVYVDAIGQAISPVTVQVRPQVAGKLLKVYIQQGDYVTEGDILYMMDPRPYQALLDEAEAQLEHDEALLMYAEKTVERYKTVVEDDFIAKLTFENYLSSAAAAKAQVELDKASIRAARINVDYCNIVAPVSGKISYFVVDVGNILAIDDPTAITSIKPFSPIDIQFSLPQQQLETIRALQGNEGKWKFIARLPEYPDKKVEGTTFFIDNQVNQNTGTILLKGRLDNEGLEFWPGEFVQVQVLFRIAENAFVVPPGAVLMGKNGAYVYTMNADKKVDVHNVTVIIRTDDYIAFDSKEINKGDTVVVDGQINIAPGVEVQIAPDKTPTQQSKTSL